MKKSTTKITTKKTEAEKDWDKQEREREKYRKVLRPYACKIADCACKAINQTVPLSVEGMRYARQWVLEETIRILQERV